MGFFLLPLCRNFGGTCNEDGNGWIVYAPRRTDSAWTLPPLRVILREPVIPGTPEHFDTGHTGANASFAIGHPEKVIDFAYRAVHEMTLKSKDLIAAFYGRAPQFSYFTGCSTGGRQGLMVARRHPEDFDGIIAGAPANDQTHLSGWRIVVEAKVLQSPASVVPPAKLALLNRAVLAACDAIDGVRDGLLTDPRQCQFDPATLSCRGNDQDDCLTVQQVEAVIILYSSS